MRCDPTVLGRSAMSTMPHLDGEVILGVDTHEREHVAALIDPVGRLIGTRAFPATLRGYRQLLAWARQHGELRRAGVEGTGSFGAGLTRLLTLETIEGDRGHAPEPQGAPPSRQERPRRR